MPKDDKKPEPNRDITVGLALERTSASYDRTLMSWMRTAISLITFGFAIYKFFQIELQRLPTSRAIGPREFSLIMVSSGLLAMALGIAEHFVNKRRLKALDPNLPRSHTLAFAVLIFALGSLALLAVIFRQ
jgi:putative membrane protein